NGQRQGEIDAAVWMSEVPTRQAGDAIDAVLQRVVVDVQLAGRLTPFPVVAQEGAQRVEKIRVMLLVPGDDGSEQRLPERRTHAHIDEVQQARIGARVELPD